MNFTTDKLIYRQIVDLCFARILSGEWEPDRKVPSVRELSAQLMVNTHTVLKAFDDLQADGIIVPRRGLGFYLAPDAPTRVLEAQRTEFFTTTLPELSRTMKMLNISINDLTAHLTPLIK